MHIAPKSKHSLILCNTDDLYIKAKFHAERLVENLVGGVIFVPTAASDEKNRMIIDIFTKNNIPVVLADRTIPDLDMDLVTTDNFDGAYAITNHLIQNGHKKIGIILSTLFSTERQRLEGYKKAFTDHKIPIDPKLIITDKGPFIEKRYIKYAYDLLKQKNRATAIFAGHDRIALVFYSAAKEMGLSIPEDISIVGYDDLHFTTVSLTTMHQPIYEMGQESMRQIMERIRGDVEKPKKIVLKSNLIERLSVQRVG